MITKTYIIPEELKKHKQWVLWNLEPRNGKDTKVPYQVNGKLASATDPLTWSSYEDVSWLSENYSGIGFVLTEHDDFTIIDLDHCFECGRLKDESKAIVDGLNSFTERSQSGNGLHIIIKGKVPGDRKRKGAFEVYEKGRYFAITGDHLEGTPADIMSRQEELNKIYFEVFKQEVEQQKPIVTVPITLDETKIIEMLKNAANSSKFLKLYSGDFSGYPSQSEADLALCSMIAFYTQNFYQIDSIFQSSGLYREKWNRKDYKEWTINRAISLANTNSYNQAVRDFFGADVKYSEQPEALEIEPAVTVEEEKENIENDFVSAYLTDFLEEIEQNKAREAISTGFKKLDSDLGGGLYPGLYVVGAISSLGKTAFIGQIADYVAEHGNDVLFFSLEMNKIEIVARSLAKEMFKFSPKEAADTRQIMNGKVENYPLLVKAMGRYHDTTAKNIAIIEGGFTTGIEQINKKIANMIKVRNKKPVVVVDYLQIINPEDPRMSDKQIIDNHIKRLKIMSRTYDIPILVISALNRANYTTTISYESFKESGAIDYTADVIIGLQLACMDEVEALKTVGAKREMLNTMKARVPRQLELVILKNRNGVPIAKNDFDYYPRFNFFMEKSYNYNE